MNTKNNIDLFTEFKNKNLQEDKIIELINLATKNMRINEIEKYGMNILIYSCLYENENVFKVISENFSTEFKDYFKKCVLLTYTNKNPNILNISLQHLDTLSNIEKEEILKKIAQNCFRSENIEVTQNWFQNSLNNAHLDLFISELFQNNNKPYLTQISKNPFWKELIKKYDFKGTPDKFIFYNSLTSESSISKSTFNESSNSEEELPIIKKDKQDLVVLKKKRRINSLATV